MYRLCNGETKIFADEGGDFRKKGEWIRCCVYGDIHFNTPSLKHFCDCVQVWVNNRILSWRYFWNVHLWWPFFLAIVLALLNSMTFTEWKTVPQAVPPLPTLPMALWEFQSEVLSMLKEDAGAVLGACLNCSVPSTRDLILLHSASAEQRPSLAPPSGRRRREDLRATLHADCMHIPNIRGQEYNRN